MEKNLFQNYPPAERERMLKDNCDALEPNHSYMKSFTHDELNEQKERFSEVSIEVSDLEERKQDVVKSINDQQKPLKKESKELLKNLKQKALLVNETTYKFVDHEAGEVGYYNIIGDLVSSRPILPNEKQTNIFNIKSAGSGQ